MAFDIQSIMEQLKQLGNWGNSSGNQTPNNGTQSFAVPSSDWSPSQSASPTFGSLAGSNLTEGVNANYGGNGLGSNSFGSGNGLGLNLGTAQLGIGGLAAIGNIFNGIQGNKLAQDQFKFTKDITNTNLNNQIQSYNTALSDRINSRAYTQGESSGWAQDYLDKNRLSR